MDYDMGFQDGYNFQQAWPLQYHDDGSTNMLATHPAGYPHYASCCQPAYLQRPGMQFAGAMTTSCLKYHDLPLTEQVRIKLVCHTSS